MPGEPLAAKQTVPLTLRDRQRLRKAAARLDVGVGLLARSLILDGLRRLDEAEIRERIATETTAERERHTRAGREAMRVRYSKSEGEK